MKNKNMKDLISIVVPIYNVEKYLKTCVDSLIKQSYENIEIILVDDGSPDNSGKMCDEYKKEDNRIKVIHKKNGGLSDARNVGLEESKGKYIMFVDSDDFIEENCLELLYNNIVKYNKEISAGQLRRFKDLSELTTDKEQEKIEYYNMEDSMKHLLYNDKYTSSTGGKLFLKDLFEDIRFPYGKKYEDLATVYKLVYKSNGVVISNINVYNYFVARNESIMNENFSATRMDALYFTEEILSFIEKNIPEIRKSAITRLIIECRDILVQIPNNKKYDEYKKIVIDYIKKYKDEVLINKESPLKKRISLFPILFGEKSIKLAWSFKDKIKHLLKK